MRRRIATICIVVLTATGWSTEQAKASCAGSAVSVFAPPIVVGSMIRAIWVLEPACDVIESGLLVGADPATLSSAGTPTYGYSEMYLQHVPVTRSGLYWLAAYARDEAGGIIQSVPRPVQLIVPQELFQTPRGSHGGLTAYTGTDDDFRRQAGDPHFASLKKAARTQQSMLTKDSAPQIIGGARQTASTNEIEVRAELEAGIPLEGFTVPADQLSLNQAFVFWKSFFSQFPRSGLYSITCGGSVDYQSGTARFFSSCSPGNPFMQFYESVSEFSVEGRRGFRDTHSVRSSLTYFVPGTPPGKGVVSARLSLLVGTVGDFSGIRLSGKLPVTIVPLGCQAPGPPAPCSVLATWDFSDEVRPLSEQGGGELRLTLDPIPPGTFEVPGQSFSRIAAWWFSPAVNYPWRHGGSENALTITFGDACPREIVLSSARGSVEPQIPFPPSDSRHTVEPRIDDHERVRNESATFTTITALIRSCLPAATRRCRIRGHPPGRREPRGWGAPRPHEATANRSHSLSDADSGETRLCHFP